MDFIIHKVVKLQHIHGADGDLPAERLTGITPSNAVAILDGVVTQAFGNADIVSFPITSPSLSI